jgi:glutathione peroxidase
MSILDAPIARLDGSAATLGEITGGKPALLVNVASFCGWTPQYAGLQALHEMYADRGFTVVGLPCNQFGEQEPGSAEEIAEFCSLNYGVTFPLTEKVEVNGEGRHPIYAALVGTEDKWGRSGDVKWNFEKFLISADGQPRARYSKSVEPDDPELVAAIEDLL